MIKHTMTPNANACDIDRLRVEDMKSKSEAKFTADYRSSY